MRQVTPIYEQGVAAAATLLTGIGLLALGVAVEGKPGDALKTAGWLLFMTGAGLILFQALLHRDRVYSRGHRDGFRLRRRVDSHLGVVDDDGEVRHRAQR
jgi:hypothetical protein